ncbi:MAG: aminotransferase class V-fold PLP-dependent enzyme [Deltaproteobacteria bacterium]|nr:aminotransferase class V-fold PLP-dependent enzyme [Deltaproteobacteria bacterium]
MTHRLIYFDNAATTFPKPPGAMHRMVEAYERMGVSPGRGSYDLAMEAEDLVFDTRKRLARLFDASDPNRVVFAGNATDALNLCIQGLLGPGDHVVSTRLEHNSVLRPLYHLKHKGLIEYDLVPFDDKGFVDPHDIVAAIKPNTRLVILCHASNVLGTIQPIHEIGPLCREKGVPLLVDAAQSAGVIPIHMDAWQIDAVAFTGHKSLMGPTGIGGLVIHPDLELQTIRFGGTGIDSESPVHTQDFPHRLEAGTINLMGIMGLSEGLRFVENEGIEAIHREEMRLLTRLRDGVVSLTGVESYCTRDLKNHVGLMTLNIQGMDPGDVGAILDADFDIAVRVGLHCAPLVHETIGTFPRGGVRFSLGPFNTEAHVDRAVEALSRISGTK